jgi:hypothetical protein
MKEAEEKSNLIFIATAALVYIGIILILMLLPTYMRDYARRAGWAWNVAGMIVFIYSYYLLYKAILFGEWNKRIWFPLFLLVLAIFITVGFNLDTFGVKDRP